MDTSTGYEPKTSMELKGSPIIMAQKSPSPSIKRTASPDAESGARALRSKGDATFSTELLTKRSASPDFDSGARALRSRGDTTFSTETGNRGDEVPPEADSLRQEITVLKGDLQTAQTKAQEYVQQSNKEVREEARLAMERQNQGFSQSCTAI